MREGHLIRCSLLAALLAVGIDQVTFGQDSPTTPRLAAADRTSLWSHIHSTADRCSQ